MTRWFPMTEWPRHAGGAARLAGVAAVLWLAGCGGGGATTAPPPAPTPPSGGGVATLVLGGRSAALPVGFQTQLFVSGANAAGVAQSNRSVVWSSSNLAVVTVDANGVITATGEGTARITALAADGSVASTTITAAVAPVASAARVGFNTALGVPTDGDPTDDVLITRRQYTVSYNPRRGVANWVAWNLDASHLGGAARCNCFTADTALARLGQPLTTTNDWINGGEYSRGHLAPSADWTSSDGDNAATYFLTNMLPQRQDMNAGPWAGFETFLRTLATGGRQLYLVAGGIWTRNRSGSGVDGFGVMPGASLAIPDTMWKVAVVVPDSRAATQVTTPAEVQVYAVKMPNVNGIASVSYTTYLTSVDAIQRSTGYDLLSAIPPAVQCVLEQRSCGASPVRVR
jgi:endonuclease G